MGRKWLEQMATSAMNEVMSGNIDASSGSKLVGSLVTGALNGVGGGGKNNNSASNVALQAAFSAMGVESLGPIVIAIQEKGSHCSKLANETVDLCVKTQTKSQQMIDFGRDIQSSLEGFGPKMDASTLETIQELTDGAKLEQAKSIAQGLDKIALDCIDKSVQMIDLMEDSMDALPDSVEGMIEDYAKQLDEDDDDDDTMSTAASSLRGLDQDVEDVTSCIKAMQELNLATLQ